MALRRSYRNIVEARVAKARTRRARGRQARQAQPQGRLARFMRFVGSSLICTALDQVIAGILFVLLREPLRGRGFVRILVGTVVARICSQTLNYVLNHRLVFVAQEDDPSQHRPSRRESLPRFLVLATGILILSTLGVYLLHSFAGMPESVAKLCMDFGLFFVNYHLQRAWVFRTEARISPHGRRRRR